MVDNDRIDLSAYNGESIVTNDLGPVCGRNLAHMAATARALRNHARGKPEIARLAAYAAVICLKRIARGFGGPKVHAALAENIERLGRM